ncbi:type II secretion system GspH family protein [Patescibacteria group bacterium]|nr:type II secretion system GspH family protein [Patescibacteria group bacterium]
MEQTKKGFTLVELLIVIGILGILAAAVVVVLNPAELLKQARDSKRMQDLVSIDSALGLYLVSTSTPNVGDGAINITQTAGGCDEGATPGVVATRTTDGAGWVNVDLDELTGGSPLSVLPIDPTNSGTYAYCYMGSSTPLTWELAAILESTKFGTTDNLDAIDGGTDDTVYEIGSDLSLITN